MPLELREVVCLLAATIVFAGLATLPVAATAAPSGAATKATASAARCGTFTTALYVFTVTRRGRVTCRFALRIIKDFVKNRDDWTRHGDGTTATTYWTSARYPRWRCGTGAGAGGCRSGNRRADYENRNR